jgi:hypothetical protein
LSELSWTIMISTALGRAGGPPDRDEVRMVFSISASRMRLKSLICCGRTKRRQREHARRRG